MGRQLTPTATGQIEEVRQSDNLLSILKEFEAENYRAEKRHWFIKVLIVALPYILLLIYAFIKHG